MIISGYFSKTVHYFEYTRHINVEIEYAEEIPVYSQ